MEGCPRESEGRRIAAWYLVTDGLLRVWTQGAAEFTKHRRRPARLSEELRLKEKAQGKWKQWWVTLEEHRDIALACRERIWKFKAQLELKEERTVKATMMFHRSALTAKRKDEKMCVSCCSWTSVGPPLDWGIFVGIVWPTDLGWGFSQHLLLGSPYRRRLAPWQKGHHWMVFTFSQKR